MESEVKPASTGPEPASAAPGSPAPSNGDVTNGGVPPEAEESAVILVPGVEPPPDSGLPTLPARIKTLLIGKPRDLHDQSIFKHVSLVAFLAWVGLGADGLSSSCYGPPEAFEHLVDRNGVPHHYLAVFLALATILTVFIISACYSHIIEEFPSGGGGYLVASKLLGRRVGVVSGCALLVDYVLTVTTSIAAAGAALFGLAGPDFAVLGLTHHETMMVAEAGAIVLLIVMNLRGVKESVTLLLPIFLIFLLTHILIITGAIGLHLGNAGGVASEIATKVHENAHNPSVGIFGMIGLFLFAYSMGGGTYTGIEAVSNSMPVMREPRVQTAKRTMRYMATSLAIAAGGLMISYLLLRIHAITDPKSLDFGKTMNQLLTAKVTNDVGLNSTNGLGFGFVLITMISEGALLFVAAQAGFIDGPRVLANMAQDSWAPHWLASLSERLASQNGILIMGSAALAALLYSQGDITTLVTMYSINVFLTFSLSMIGMCRHWWQLRGINPIWLRRFALFATGGAMCVFILCVTVYEKFKDGGWVTLAVTSLCVGLCFLIHRYYRGVVARLKRLDDSLSIITAPKNRPPLPELDRTQPVAAILVGGYSGLGVHTALNTVRFAPNHFKAMVFMSVAVVDSGNFKGADAVEGLQHHTEEMLAKYVDLAQSLGMPAASYMAIGTDPVEELEHLCKEIAKKYPKVIVFAGQLVFQRDSFIQRLLHNQTAYALQRRLQWDGLPMVILPTRVK
jgi:amino acid transporter